MTTNDVADSAAHAYTREMAMIHQGLREYDKMFELAEQLRLTEGVDEEILVDPKLDEVRHLPQFQAFLEYDFAGAGLL